MNRDELIDIYDEQMNLLGTAPRSQAHREGLWHMTFHCWIVSRPDKIWLQRRGEHVETHPNKLDISSAGHLLTGERPKDGIREIKEELGLDVDFDKLTKLFTGKKITERPGYINHEFTATYLLETHKKLSELILNPEEVSGVYEICIDDLINLFNRKVSKVYGSGLVLGDDGTFSLQSGAFGICDFTPHSAEYYLKILNTAKRYLENSKAA